MLLVYLQRFNQILAATWEEKCCIHIHRLMYTVSRSACLHTHTHIHTSFFSEIHISGWRTTKTGINNIYCQQAHPQVTNMSPWEAHIYMHIQLEYAHTQTACHCAHTQ
ncbi:hypothetical protein ILYODFUR_015942 [Ilyodon furcidens]|uniref:Uncharacterized protein n=1 Tax=Ilyodon furcidens TaxID=33524 RepID=A0ABV0UHG1_9TELE